MVARRRLAVIAFTLLPSVAVARYPASDTTALAATGTAPTAEQMVVYLSDLPAGFIEGQATLVTRKHIPAVYVRSYGAQFSYGLEFDRQYGSGQRTGVYEVNDNLIGFATAQGAHRYQQWFVRTSLSYLKGLGRYDIRSMSIPPIGNEAAAWTYKTHTKSGTHTAVIDLVVFRRAAYWTDLLVTGYAGTLKSTYERWLILKLASLVDQRIQRATSSS